MFSVPRPARILAALTVAVSTIAVGAAAPAFAACEHPIGVRPTPPPFAGNPFGITAGPGGTWYGRGAGVDLIPAGGGPIQTYPVDPAAAMGWVATRGPAAHVVWFAERGTGRLGYLGLSGHPHEFQIPDGVNGTSVPQAIVFGGPRQVYFTDQANNRIGLLDTTTRAFTFWVIPTPDSETVGMTMGPDGDLYFSERGFDKIGRLDPRTGLFTEWSLTAGAFPNRFAVTPDGNVWFTELRTDQLGYIDPSGHLHEIATTGGPVGIVYSDGYLYAADFTAGQLTQIDLTGTITHTWALPHAKGVLQVAPSQGFIWVADGFGHLVYNVNVGCS